MEQQLLMLFNKSNLLLLLTITNIKGFSWDKNIEFLGFYQKVKPRTADLTENV